jgi:hypothetical protein
VANYDSNHKYQQTIWNELEAEISTAGLGKNQGRADDPQADESEDEMSVEDGTAVQLKNELISRWRLDVLEKVPRKPELRRDERTLSESMESRKQPEEATVHERPSGEPLVPEEYEQGIDSETSITAGMMSRQPTASIGKTTFNRKNPLLEKIWKQQRTILPESPSRSASTPET